MAHISANPLPGLFDSIELQHKTSLSLLSFLVYDTVCGPNNSLPFPAWQIPQCSLGWHKVEPMGSGTNTKRCSMIIAINYVPYVGSVGTVPHQGGCYGHCTNLIGTDRGRIRPDLTALRAI